MFIIKSIKEKESFYSPLQQYISKLIKTNLGLPKQFQAGATIRVLLSAFMCYIFGKSRLYYFRAENSYNPKPNNAYPLGNGPAVGSEYGYSAIRSAIDYLMEIIPAGFYDSRIGHTGKASSVAVNWSEIKKFLMGVNVDTTKVESTCVKNLHNMVPFIIDPDDILDPEYRDMWISALKQTDVKLTEISDNGEVSHPKLNQQVIVHKNQTHPDYIGHRIYSYYTNLSKDKRRNNIIIHGIPNPVDFDITKAYPTFYAALHALPELSYSVANRAGYNLKDIKSVAHVMMSGHSVRSLKSIENVDYSTAKKIANILKSSNPSWQSHWYAGVTYSNMCSDFETQFQLILRNAFVGKGIKALYIHDGFVVDRKNKHIALHIADKQLNTLLEETQKAAIDKINEDRREAGLKRLTYKEHKFVRGHFHWEDMIPDADAPVNKCKIKNKAEVSWFLSPKSDKSSDMRRHKAKLKTYYDTVNKVEAKGFKYRDVSEQMSHFNKIKKVLP